MKQVKVFLSCTAAVFLSAGCTASPNSPQVPQVESAPVSQLDPGSCYIAGSTFDSDATIALKCSGDASAQIIFEDGEAVSTSGQLHGWTPLDASHGTSDDPDFIRIQIQKGDRVCTYGRKLDEAPEKTWKNCDTKNELNGGKLTRPKEQQES